LFSALAFRRFDYRGEDEGIILVKGSPSWCSGMVIFGSFLGGPDYPQPAVIYAANPDATTGEEPSQRPVETIIPLSGRLGLKTVTTCEAGQESKLAAELVGLTGGVALVCWGHKAIVH